MENFVFIVFFCGPLFLLTLAVIKAHSAKPQMSKEPLDVSIPVELEYLEDLAQDLQEEIYNEWLQASLTHGAFNSSHEGFAVLHEEFDELKAEVWKNGAKHPDRNDLMRKEAIQVAAMALRFLTDCCEHPIREENDQ